MSKRHRWGRSVRRKQEHREKKRRQREAARERRWAKYAKEGWPDIDEWKKREQ